MNSVYEACNVLLTTCSNCKKEENILFVTDETSYEVALAMWNSAKDYGNKTLIKMNERTMHGQEPTKVVTAAMLSADVIFGITKFSLFHTDARRNAVANGSRFINMVDYNMAMIINGCLKTDFVKQGYVLDKVTEKMIGDTINITTPIGTNITATIKSRQPVPQYGRSIEGGQTSSPPDIECAVGPIEKTAKGIVYIDGSIPHPEIGLITEKIKLIVENGDIVDIVGGKQAQILKKVLESFADPNAYSLGEIGIGLNPNCTLSGRMLEDEGCMGTVHFGFGSNTSFFGTIESKCHLDMVFKNPTVVVDGHIVLKDGNVPY